MKSLIPFFLLALCSVAYTQQSSEKFKPFHFAVLSDLHLSERQGMARLDKALQMIHDRGDIAFVIVEGDIVWDKNPAGLKNILKTAGVPVHLVYGNNDWKWVKDGTYEKAFGPRDYAFVYNNCLFIQMWDCLPKEYLENHRGQLSEEQWAWLENQLKQAKTNGITYTFTSMHVPPAAPGGFNNLFFMLTDTQQRFYNLIDKYHVNVCLFGHLHQSLEWKHEKTLMYVNPSCCWNFISRTKKVDSSFVRFFSVERDGISPELVPVHLPGETFTYANLADFYNPADHPK